MASPIDGHEFEQTPGDSEGQGSQACCSPWGRKELDMTEQLNNSNSLTLMISILEIPVDGKLLRRDINGRGILAEAGQW